MSKPAPREEPDLDIPPPYTEAPSAASANNVPIPSYSSSSAFTSLYTSHLSAHISSLPSQIRTTQQAHQSQQQSLDLAILARLAPHIEDLLATIADSPVPPVLAELTLVPAAAVPADWTLSGLDGDRRADHSSRLVRVSAYDKSDDAKGARVAANGTGSSSTSARSFDEWGRWSDDDKSMSSASSPNQWWWKDEVMAARLARHLQPRIPDAQLERTAVKAAAQQIKEERKASRWSLFRGSSTVTGIPAASAAPQAPAGFVRPTMDDDRVTMTARAEEVTFRKENALGIWESMRGMGIVVRVKVRRT